MNYMVNNAFIAFGSGDNNIINKQTTNFTMCENGSEIQHSDAEDTFKFYMYAQIVVWL